MRLPAILPSHIQSGLRLLLTLAASIVTLRLGAGLAAWRAANNLEKPSYTVVRRLPMSPPSRGGTVEVRKYEPYLIAETTVNEPSMRKAGAAGFGKCAGYIFGKNEPRTKGGGGGRENGDDGAGPIGRHRGREDGNDVPG